MKKLISKILLITLLASAIIPQGIIDTSYAQTNNWDFSIPGDYTISDSTKMEVANGLGRLKYVMTHQGSIVNGGTRLLNGARGVVVEGNYAYVASNISDAIEIVDITNPLVPVHVSSIANGGTRLLNGPVDLIKSGNYLYVASNVSDAVEIINVTNPAAPVHVGSIIDTGTTYLNGASGLFLVGNYLYVTSNLDDALEIINVTNPAAPVHVGSLRNTTRLNGAQSVFVSGNYAYVTSNLNNSLEVINISNPAAPAFAAQLTNGTGGAVLGGAYGIKIVGNYAYITSNTSNALEVVNITNPLAPAHYSSITSGGTTLLGAPRSLAIDGNLTFVASNTSNAIEVVDMVPLSAPIHLASIANGGTTLLSGASDVKKVGNLVYVASEVSDALEIIKAEFPTDSPSIQPVLSQSYVGGVTSLTEVLGANNAGTVTYQISKDGGTTWYYFNGTSWVATTGGTAQSSSMAQINSNLIAFNALAGTNTFKWKAFLNSNGSQKVELDSIQLQTLPPYSFTNPVFHFDALDVNGNGNYTDEPANESYVTSWVDVFNGYNATQGTTANTPILGSSKIGTHTGVIYQGDNDYQTITDQALISTSSFSKKSFAMVFKTGNDITTFQNIYKQGTNARGYAIQIENSNLYAGAWNTSWGAGNQYKAVTIPNIRANTEYRIVMVQDSTAALLANRTLKVYVDGTLMGTQNSVDVQQTHAGGVSVGNVTGTAIKLSNNSSITAGNYFNGNIGELFSWNDALIQTQVDSINLYLYDKWVKSGPIISYVYPQETGVVSAGNFNLNISYDDGAFGTLVDKTTDVIKLYKWNGTIWGADISNTYINKAGKTISNFEVTYPVNSIINGKYKLAFSISNTNGFTSTKELLFNVGETLPSAVPNEIFHYDAQDTNGDGILNNEGNLNGDSIQTLVDKVNAYNATQATLAKRPTYATNTINGYQSLNFNGSQIYGVSNQGIINTNATFPEKSFAAVFKTGNDINTFQTIYEQGGAVRGYSFIIHNGHVWAGVWNLTEWDAGHQYKSVDMGPALPNTVYFSMIVQDSQSILHTNNTLKIYLNGNLASIQEHVAQQYAHPGLIGFGGVINDTVRASDNLPITSTEGYYFTGNIGELISWNHSLDRAEINGVQEYFSKKWGIVIFSEKYPVPDPTSNHNPTYKFDTNTSGILTYGGSCKSVTTSATVGENTINFDIDGAGGYMPDGFYNNCIITLRDTNGFDHVLNVTPFHIISSVYTLTEITPVPLYSSNHFPQYTFNTPISGNIEYYGGCTSNTTTAAIGDNTVTFNYLPVGNYSSCYLRIVNGPIYSEFLNITGFHITDTGPVLDSKSLVANRLYPIGNINFNYNYHDTGGSGINLASEKVELFKYNSGTSSYGPDIASSYISNLSVSETQATYSSTGIPFGKYKVIFHISSISGSPLTVETIIYIDTPELIISTGSINIGNLTPMSNVFSPEITVTVKTLGAGFNIKLNKTSLMQNINLDEIVDWNGSKGIGYEKDPYSSLISKINTNEILANQTGSLNTNGDRNTYTYKFKIGSLIDAEQQAGNYQTHLSFGIDLSY